jgi:L-asparaginase
LEELELAARHGMVIVSVSQCRGGSVEQGVYATSAGLEQLGVVGASDMTVEAALVKLMFLFGKKLNPKEVAKQMAKSYCGELTN